MDQKPKIGYFPIGRIHFDSRLAQESAKALYESIKDAGFEVVGNLDVSWNNDDIEKALSTSADEDLDIALVLNTTFTDSSMVKRIAERMDAPVVLWSIPEQWRGGRLRLNSFTGMNLAAHALKQSGIYYFYIYANPSDSDSTQYLKRVALAARAVKSLKSSKIGIIGEHPEGFETCDYNNEQLQELFGVGIKTFSIQEFFNDIGRIGVDQIKSIKEKLSNEIDGMDKLEQDAIDSSLASYLAFMQLKKNNGIAGLAVRCWPEFFTELKCSACGALALATENGLPCSCEADVLGLLSQILLEKLSGNSAVGIDLVGFDFEKNQAALWHCGNAPLDFANPKEQIKAIEHTNRGLPLLFQFAFKPGVVTIARLHQMQGQITLIINRGKMLDLPGPYSGTCGIIEFERPANEVYKMIMDLGLEHHIAFTYGDVVDELEVTAELLGLPVINLINNR